MNYSPNAVQNEAAAVANNAQHTGDLLPDKSRVKNRYEFLLSGEGFLCFSPSLGSPMEDEGEVKGFGCTIALPKGVESTDGLIAKADAMFTLAFGKKKVKNALFKDGDAIYESKMEEAEEDDKADVEAFYGRFRGHFYFNVKTKFNGYYVTGKDGRCTDELVSGNFVKYRDADGKPISGDKFTNGATVRADFLMAPYSVKGNYGIYCQQNNVQLLLEGDVSSQEESMGMSTPDQSVAAVSDEEAFGM